MRLAYGALVLSSLFLREDLSGDWEQPESALPPWRSPPVKWLQFQNTFGYPHAFCWASSQSQWALRLAGVAALLLWLWTQVWLKGPPPEPKPETQRELDFQIPQKRDSLCICGEPLIPRFARFEPIRRRRRSSSVICHISGSRLQNVKKSDYRRKYPLVIPRILSSSSSSSSSSSIQLKNLAVQTSCGLFPMVTTVDSSCMVSNSLEELESKTLDLSSEADDHSSHKIEQKPSPIYYRYPEVKKSVPQIQDIPECSETRERPEPDVEKPVPQIREIIECSKICERPEKRLPEKRVPSFAQIFVQSSAFQKDDGVFLVEKSLQIRMVPSEGDKPPILIEEEGGGQTNVLALLGRIVNAEGGLKVEKPSRSKAFPPTGRFGWNVAVRTTSALSDFDPNALIVTKMDKGNLGLLEFHVKKKMVQHQCGVPTVVVRSLQHFLSMGDFSPMEWSVKGLTPICARSPASLVLARRNVKPIYAKPWQKPFKERERYVLHRAMEAGRVTSSIKKPSATIVSSQGLRKKYVLLSMQPEELKRIVFHVTAKMLAIKKGAFPDIVEGSFRTFSRFSCRPLPKTIRLGNKVPRVKQAALPFVPKEVLCLIDLNIKHKYLVYAWRLPTPFDNASGASEGQKTPALVNKGMVQAQLSGQILVAPGSRMPFGLLSSSPQVFAEETPEGPAQLLAEEMEEEHTEKRQEGHPEKMKEHLEMMQEGQPEKTEEQHPEKTQEAEGEKPKESLLPSSVESPKPPEEVAGHEERPEKHLTCTVPPQMVAGETLPGVDDGQTMGTEEAKISLKQTEPGRSGEVPPTPPFSQRGQDGEGSEIKEDRGSLKQPERPPSPKAVLRPGMEEVSKRPKEATNMRASLMLQLDLAKEKLNLHLQKKLDTTLQPKQGARLDLDMGLEGRAKGHRRRHPHRSDRPTSRSGSRSRRPFVYVCMPLDDSGSAVKTVRWYLPNWIQEMNGHRDLQVARFERKAPRCK